MFKNILKNKEIETAEKVVEKNPNNILKLNILGELYAKHKFYKEAISILEKILRLDENYLPAIELLGKVYIKNKQYLKAYRTLLHLYKITNGDFKTRTILFSLKDSDCDIEAKIEIIKGLIEIESSIELKEKLASLYLESGQFVKSATLYEELLDIESKSGYLQQLSKIYIKLQKYSAASNCLEKLMQTENFSLDDAQILAGLYEKESRFEEAKGIYELLINSKPNNAEIFKEKIAKILMQENQIDKALEITNDVIADNKYSVEAKFIQADALIDKKEYENAIEFLREFHCDPIDNNTEKLIEKKIIETSIVYSKELRAEKKYTEAIDALMPALRYDENNKEIYVELARISTEIRDYSSAKEYMKIAEEL